MDADFSELMQLAHDLETAPQNVAKPLAKALGVTSGKIKKDARTSVRARHSRFRHAATAIDYDLEGISGPVSEMRSEIGYNKDHRRGRIGNWIEFGAPNAGNTISPSHDLGNALLNNESDFLQGVSRAVDDSLKASGL